MKLGDIYEFLVKEGIKADPRTKKQVQSKLSSERREFRKLKSFEKKLFDKDNLWNPYADTRVLNGQANLEIKRILIGIDIGIGELYLAEELGKRGKKIDLIMAHHPIGIALTGLFEVMDLQASLLENLGFEQRIAKKLMDARTRIVERGLHSANYSRVVDAARLLNVPLMCCHTPADNHVATFLQREMDKQKPKTLSGIIKFLLKHPEYRDALKDKAGPKILAGKSNDTAGKTIVDMTGGTEGSKDIFGRVSQLGVNTLLAMHLSEAHLSKAKDEHLNVVNAGHMASDNLGINLLLDKLVKKDKIEIVACSGFRRFKR